jgi:hypothetical protein
MTDPAPEQNPTPGGLAAIILEVLKNYFSVNSKQFRYSLDSTETKLAIQKSESFNPENTQKRPALYVKRGSIMVNRDVLGDGMDRNPRGEKAMFVRLSGTITVYCLGRTGGEIDALVAEVMDCVLCFQTLISADFDFLRFKVNSIGEVGILEEYKEIFACPVVLEYDTDINYVLGVEALPIKKFLYKLKLGDSDVENSCMTCS